MKRIYHFYLTCMTLTLTMPMMIVSAFAVDDMWTVANNIIVDVYGKIVGVSTVLAGLMSAVAVIGAKLSNNQHKVDQAWDWLKRIWIAWAIINGIGAFIAYYEKTKTDIQNSLKEFIGKDGVVDGSGLQESWFSTKQKFDVFLSHSHTDEKLAISLAGFLKRELNLNTFIDSCLWGYSNDLLREIDEKYCRHSNGTSFDYDKRNYSTSHVHIHQRLLKCRVCSPQLLPSDTRCRVCCRD